jgi:uncharacterized SAM-binding protein YcdF (DUF218 family)
MRILFNLACIFLVLWASGLVAFMHQLPVRAASPGTNTDAIVVLTGGSLRVDHGLMLLSQGLSNKLLISGVGQGTTLEEILAAHTSQAVRQKIAAQGGLIMLDYQAQTTQTNAEEVTKFVRAHAIRSVRLVTANYHMPRSVLELSRAMPQVHFFAEPVYPANFRRDQWWRHQTTRELVLSEYHKYWLARLRLSLT